MKVKVNFTAHARQRVEERVVPTFREGSWNFVKKVARRGMALETAERSGARWISRHEANGWVWCVIWEKVHERLILVRTVYARDPRDGRSDLREPMVTVKQSLAHRVCATLNAAGHAELAEAFSESEGFYEAGTLQDSEGLTDETPTFGPILPPSAVQEEPWQAPMPLESTR